MTIYPFITFYPSLRL